MDKNNENRNENLSFVSDEDALKEIDFGSFLDEATKPAPVFEGFHEDNQKTEKIDINTVNEEITQNVERISKTIAIITNNYS